MHPAKPACAPPGSCTHGMPARGHSDVSCHARCAPAPAERAQLIGRYLALGVDAPLWERLAQAVPEIIPRGARGWRKYY